MTALMRSSSRISSSRWVFWAIVLRFSAHLVSTRRLSSSIGPFLSLGGAAVSPMSLPMSSTSCSFSDNVDDIFSC